MVMTYVQGIFNIVSDFYVLVLPLPVVWKLQLPLRKKIAVSAVFMTGLLSVPLNLNPGLCITTYRSYRACGASSLGLYYRILLSNDSDWTRHEVGLGSTVILEMTLGIICGCMPYLAPMLKRWYLRWSQLSLLKNLMSRISSLRKRPGRSPGSAGFSEIESRPPNDHYLETNILRSVKGEGKFLGSQFHVEK
ncbi:hypothetical protein MMC31_004801, partial [Peltigera leucophlebia]|nr:hypothetical protein [Peltigera leucophlebia]